MRLFRRLWRYKVWRYTLRVVGVLFFFIAFNNILIVTRPIYPEGNLKEIVDEIEVSGHTNAQPHNHFRKRYVVLIDPVKNMAGNLDMIFIVKSFVGSFAIRSAIRSTWGVSKNFKLQTIFVVGHLPDLQQQLEFESKRYNDILQYNVSDTYVNLVYKTIFSVEWLVYSGVATEFVHLLDDDRMVNTDNLYKFARNNIFKTELKMIGYCLTSARPNRRPSSKFFISEEEYPYYYYPPYIIGGTILTNMQVIKKLAISFPYTRIIHIEDVYIGIVSRLLNIQVVHDKGFLPDFVPGEELADKLSCPNYKSYHMIIDEWIQMKEGIRNSQNIL